MQSPELQNKIAQWRARAIAGTLSLEETRQAIIDLRGDRKSAVAASSTRKTKAAPQSVDSMLDELDNL